MESASDIGPAPPSRLERLVRSLRNLTALGLLTLSFGVLALWVRSNWKKDVVWGWFGVPGYLQVDSNGGTLRLLINQEQQKWTWKYKSQKREGDQRKWFLIAQNHQGGLGRELDLKMPYFLIALALVIPALALKPKPRLKFSLADLLVLMTFSAVLIAGVAGLTRLAS
jgi:hypothetical protein